MGCFMFYFMLTFAVALGAYRALVVMLVWNMLAVPAGMPKFGYAVWLAATVIFGAIHLNPSAEEKSDSDAIRGAVLTTIALTLVLLFSWLYSLVF